MIGTVLLWALFFVLLGAAAVVLVYGPVPCRDPGPWVVDGRLKATSKDCRFVSRASEGRCTRGADHWGRHDRHLDAVDERFTVGATARALEDGSARGR